MCSPDPSNYLGTLLLPYFLVELKTADPNALEFPVEINFDFSLKIWQWLYRIPWEQPEFDTTKKMYKFSSYSRSIRIQKDAHPHIFSELDRHRLL